VECRDTPGNNGVSETRNFTMNATAAPPSSGGGGAALPQLSVLADASCSGNIITVMGAGEPVSGVRVVIGGLTVYYTDASGQVNFTGCGGRASIHASAEGYMPVDTNADLTDCAQCAAVIPPVQNQTIPSNQTQPPGGGPSMNQTNQTIPSNQTQNATQPGPTMQDAAAAIASADAAIGDAGRAGKDTTDAKNLLAQANAAFAAGNYADAIALANRARQSAINAAAPPAPANQTGAAVTQPPGQQPVWLLLLGALAIVALIGGAAYYLLAKGAPPKGLPK
jgi:hypothetical protein